MLITLTNRVNVTKYHKIINYLTFPIESINNIKSYKPGGNEGDWIINWVFVELIIVTCLLLPIKTFEYVRGKSTPVTLINSFPRTLKRVGEITVITGVFTAS